MNDDVKWITKGGKHIPITNNYMNDFIRGKKDIKVYRAGKETGELESGTFFAANEIEASNYGEAKEYTIDKSAKLYKGKSTKEYSERNNLMDIKDKKLKEILGVETLNEVQKIYYEWTTPSYLDKNPNLYFFAYQYMAKEDLNKKGYDGAFWEWEDDLTPSQYQIWNKKIIKK